MLTGAVSLLELFHPDGRADRSVVLGGGCPVSLLPVSHADAADNADLIILAPTDDECRTRRWLEQAGQSIIQRLTADGVAYVLAPQRWRVTVRRLLRDYGLRDERTIVHLPDAASSRYLAPLTAMPLNYVLTQLVPIPRWMSSLAMAGSRLVPFEAFLGSVLPWVGLVMRRAGARPMFDWLFQMQPADGQPGAVVIGTSWRGQQGAVILHRFSRGDARPSAVAKMNLTKQHAGNRAREAIILASLGPAARSAGAQIPELLSFGQINHYPVLLQSPISGQSFAKLLSSHPNRLPEVLERITAWLERWNRETMAVRSLDCGLRERDFLAPAATLAPVLENGDEYRKWLEMRSARLLGVPVPLVATHNDLTMWNIFRENKEDLAIIDWETARDADLPLVDLFYAAVDGVAATQGYGDRFKAFEACFAAGGTYEPVIDRLVRRLQRIIRAPGEMLELCFHSCWIHHAANEHLSTHQSEGPFVEIVQWLAVNRRQISSWIRA